MPNFLDEQYWTERYLHQKTGWDIGKPSDPIKQYLDQFSNKDAKILIPGAGNAYEAAYAYRAGFTQVFVLDFSPVPLEQFRISCPEFPQDQIFTMDFFSHQGKYDLILEQTFFCAINPSMRPLYAAHMHRLLKPGGKLVGVLFDRNFSHEGPPFGGGVEEYLGYFGPYFSDLSMDPCYNSIPPRMGSEVFLKARKS